MRLWMGLAAAFAFVAVAMGAFAAHGIDDARAVELIRTGANYGFMHAVATIACAVFMTQGARQARFAPAFFLSGVVLFSGSLYALAFGAPTWLDAVTPFGGLSFLIGWAILAWASLQIGRPERP